MNFHKVEVCFAHDSHWWVTSLCPYLDPQALYFLSPVHMMRGSYRAAFVGNKCPVSTQGQPIIGEAMEEPGLRVSSCTWIEKSVSIYRTSLDDPHSFLWGAILSACCSQHSVPEHEAVHQAEKLWTRAAQCALEIQAFGKGTCRYCGTFCRLPLSKVQLRVKINKDEHLTVHHIQSQGQMQSGSIALACIPVAEWLTGKRRPSHIKYDR